MSLALEGLYRPQLLPQFAHLSKDFGDDRRGRQRGHSPRAGEIVDTELHDVKAQFLGSNDQFGIDERAFTFQNDMLENRRADEFEREIHVTHAHPEEHPHQKVVEERIHRTDVSLSGAVEAICADDVGLVLPQQPAGLLQFLHVERQIGICVEDQITARFGKTRLDRTAQFAIHRVMDGADSIIGSCSFVGEPARCIRRCIVDDDDLVVADLACIDQRPASLVRCSQGSCDVLLFVPHRKEERQLLRVRRLIHHSGNLSAPGWRDKFGIMDGQLPPPRVRQRPVTLRLTPGWSRTLSIGWGGLTLALVCTGISSHIIGRPVFWLDDQRWPVLVLIALSALVIGTMALPMLWSYANGPRTAYVSCFASAVLIVVAVMDRHDSPGAAVVQSGLAVAGVLLSIAAFAGRYRVQPGR